MEEDDEDAEKIDPRLLQYPETVQFTGASVASLKSTHVISLAVVIAGLLIAINTYPAGLLLLVVFLAIVFGFEFWMMKKSVKVLRITLYLREDPVQAADGSYRIGEIETGAIDVDMEKSNELGFRPAPKHRQLVWTFDSEHDAEVTAKRLLEYLPRDKAQD
ncbi:MAG: hypothetical protein ACRECH_12085 [Nitrososphaerales archaeon]